MTAAEQPHDWDCLIWAATHPECTCPNPHYRMTPSPDPVRPEPDTEPEEAT